MEAGTLTSWPSASGDIMYENCDVTLNVHFVEASCEFVSGTSSWQDKSDMSCDHRHCNI